MPFHEGTYYPYVGDPQGHSSAGIPSLLNSPLSPAPQQTMTTSSGAPALPPFRFSLRRESMDWRRINAVDVDQVVSQVDVDVLQVYLTAVTFCSLEGECCPHCRKTVDPSLVKVLRLAQLSVEWLLHCQEILSNNLRNAEERLAAADNEHQQLLDKMKKQKEKQKEKVKGLTVELQQRKKIIEAQQSMLPAEALGNMKCPHCVKSFLNSFYLQCHLQRRHPEEYDVLLLSEKDKKNTTDALKLEINNLKEQMVQQQQEFEAKRLQEKELQSQKDRLSELDRHQAETLAKIEDSRVVLLREMEVLHNRSIQSLNEVNQNQPVRQEKFICPAHMQPERDTDVDKETQKKAIQRLEQQIRERDKKWESRLQVVLAQHEAEKEQLKDEVSRLEQSQSEHHQKVQQKMGDISRSLQMKAQHFQVQREQMKTISSNPPTEVKEVPAIAFVPAAEPKQKRVNLEEPVSALKLDPIQELSEEERESSRSSEKRPSERKPEPAPEKKPRVSSAVLKSDPQIRKELELTLNHRLEALGINPDQSRLKSNEFHAVLTKLVTKQDGVTNRTHDFLQQRKEMVYMVEQRLSDGKTRSNPPAHQKSRRPPQVLQIQPRSRSLPFGSSPASAAPAVQHPQTPHPAPRTRTPQPKTSTPNAKTASRGPPVKKPLSSSEEESDSETEEDEPVKYLWSKSPNLKLNQSPLVQAKAKQAPAQKVSAGSATKKATVKSESDVDWTDESELQEINPRQQQHYRNQNGNVQKTNQGKENKINNLARKMEQQFAEGALKKPAGGVSIFPVRKEEVQQVDKSDSEDVSDWLTSLEEDSQEEVKPRARKKSTESPSTSAWWTSTGKAPSSGLPKGGTGSTLMSSLCSLSDISDS